MARRQLGRPTRGWGGLGGGWLLGFSGDVVALSVAGLLCSLWSITMLLWLKPIDNRQQT